MQHTVSHVADRDLAYFVVLILVINIPRDQYEL